MDTTIKLIIALLPFTVLFAGMLMFRWGSLRTCLYACLLEFVVVWSYYHASLARSLEAALWGTLTLWSAITVIWAGQIFGHMYRRTGLMKYFVSSVESIFPKKDLEGRAMTLLAPVSGLIGNFHGMAAYPLIVPGLVDLGFEKTEAAAATLVYMAWGLPFSGLFVAPIIAAAATHLSVPEICRAAGLYSIPLIFTCVFAAFKLLRFKIWKAESQAIFWIVSLSYVAGIVLFTQIYPDLYLLSLFAGAGLALAGLTLYGSYLKRGELSEAKLAAAAVGVTAASALTVKSPAAVMTAGIETIAAPLAQSPEGKPLASPPEAARPPWSVFARAYGPLIFAVCYIVAISTPLIGDLYGKLAFNVSAWGQSPVKINLFTSPAFTVLVVSLSCYAFATTRSNVFSDLAAGSKRSYSSLATLVLSSAIMYLMADTGQIRLLGTLLAAGGRTLFELLDSALVVLGGTIFGAGTPAIYTFGAMQMPVAAKFGIPLAILAGLVVVGALGSTNGLKPPTIRFVASLVNLEGEHDGEIFRKGLFWTVVQVVVTTATLFILTALWK